jgi:hypothetical protein
MQQSTYLLDDNHVAQALADAFAPHRCVVEFQDRSTKILLRIRGTNGSEFVVEGKRVEKLRNPDALAQYVRDVRSHLGRFRLRFYDLQPDLNREPPPECNASSVAARGSVSRQG